MDDWDGNTYRAVYTASLAGAIYVLHVFRKKATRGIATPRHVIECIKGRLRKPGLTMPDITEGSAKRCREGK